MQVTILYICYLQLQSFSRICHLQPLSLPTFCIYNFIFLKFAIIPYMLYTIIPNILLYTITKINPSLTKREILSNVGFKESKQASNSLPPCQWWVDQKTWFGTYETGYFIIVNCWIFLQGMSGRLIPPTLACFLYIIRKG